ncbi:MAG TPA: ribonuclease HI family protein [Nitrososphaeria archaeon]|nr:ribonuclease HI family protein [Nitrososphaeria archaeon]
MKALKIFFDGSSHGNPGPSGIGIIILDELGRILVKFSKFIGFGTNNEAEYHALIEALRRAIHLNAEKIELYSDSELVVKQVKGVYSVKDEKLKRLHLKCVELLKNFKEFEIKYIPRELNVEADRLANEAIAKYLKKIEK